MAEITAREQEIYASLQESYPNLQPQKQLLLKAAARATYDEERARDEYNAAIDAGDVNGARHYATIVRDFRSQTAALLSKL